MGVLWGESLEGPLEFLLVLLSVSLWVQHWAFGTQKEVLLGNQLVQTSRSAGYLRETSKPWNLRPG